MKLFNILLLTILLITSSCGFQVIYDEKRSGIKYEQELASIKIQKSPGRLSQRFRNDLYDLLNPNYIEAEPKYYIVANLKESRTSTFLTSTGASGRFKVTIKANYTFYDLKTGKKIAIGETEASDNYDIERNRYGTYTAENYTKENLVRVLASNLRNLIVNDIIEMKKREEENKELDLDKELEKEEELKKQDRFRAICPGQKIEEDCSESIDEIIESKE